MKTGNSPGDYLFWIWFSRRLGVGSVWCEPILSRMGTPFEVFRAEDEELREALPDLPDRVRLALGDKSLEEAYDILDYCGRNRIGMLCYGDPRYPLSFRSLSDPPVLLYYRGTLPDFQSRLLIAMVGTRKMSEYGRNTAYKIAYELAAAGAVVVSGMALGVDSVASCAALAAGGDTVAILGSGIDVIYPKEHTAFYGILTNRALVMSEFAPGTQVQAQNFPIRNRLISGLCQGTLVVEAGERSGALITADRALLQGRELYAVPGNIDNKNAAGSNRLLHEGARMVLCADDILREHSLLYRNTLENLSTASLGARSDYDGRMLARMGVFSQTAGAHRVPAEQLAMPDAQSRADVPEVSGRRAAQPGFYRERNHPSPASQTPPTSCPEADRRASEQVAERASERTAGCDRVVDCDRATDRDRGRVNGSTRGKAAASPQAKPVQLSEKERMVFEALPMDHPVAIDRLQALGLRTGEILTALSMLEIKGLIQTLPGGLYCRV